MLQNKSSEENFPPSSVPLPAQQSFADFPPVGIDSLALYTPGFYLDLTELAQARGVDPNKYTIGIGQDQQAVAPSNQDIVTMGAAAGLKALYFADSAGASDTGHTNIGLLVVGTESGVDASKASALFIHDLIGLSPWCRSIEIKEACYGGTAGLMTAVDYVHTHPGKKALVIASDIARYGLNTPGEVTQGAGAVAMVISENPRILALEPQSTAYSRSIGDFWRPVYTDMALARGKYSTEEYINFFHRVWKQYKNETGRSVKDFAAICFHLPYTKMGMKAFRGVLDSDISDNNISDSDISDSNIADNNKTGASADSDISAHTHGHFLKETLEKRYQASTLYSRQIGNIYTGSLYLSLLSLLDHDSSLSSGDRLGLFSYGSGAVGEFFSGILQDGYSHALHRSHTQTLLHRRHKVSVAEYEKIFNDAIPYQAEDVQTDQVHRDPWNPFILDRVEGQERIYRRL